MLTTTSGGVLAWSALAGTTTPAARPRTDVKDNQWRCTRYRAHPRTLLCWNETGVTQVDLRSQEGHVDLASCSDFDHLTADERFLCASLHPRNAYQSFVGSTSHVSLLDERYMTRPLCAWEHVSPGSAPFEVRAVALEDGDGPAPGRVGVVSWGRNGSAVLSELGPHHGDEPSANCVFRLGDPVEVMGESSLPRDLPKSIANRTARRTVGAFAFAGKCSGPDGGNLVSRLDVVRRSEVGDFFCRSLAVQEGGGDTARAPVDESFAAPADESIWRGWMHRRMRDTGPDGAAVADAIPPLREMQDPTAVVAANPLPPYIVHEPTRVKPRAVVPRLQLELPPGGGSQGNQGASSSSSEGETFKRYDAIEMYQFMLAGTPATEDVHTEAANTPPPTTQKQQQTMKQHARTVVNLVKQTGPRTLAELALALKLTVASLRNAVVRKLARNTR